MATFDGKFIRGAAGGLTFKKQGNKQIVQGKSKKLQIDMTDATFDAAYVFGKASTLASYIRNDVHPIIGINYDGGMISRFTGQCNQILQQAATDKKGNFDFSQDYFSRLNGFEFNLDSPVKNLLFSQPLVSLTAHKITIDFPEIQIPKDLKFPPNATYCTVAFNVGLFDLVNNTYKSQEVQSFEIEIKPKSFTAPAQQLEFEASPGTVAIISLALFYAEKTFAGKAIINNKKLNPAAILKAALCPGELVEQKLWSKMQFNEKKARKKAKKKPKKTNEKIIQQ